MDKGYPQVGGLLLAEVLDSLPARLAKKIDLSRPVDGADTGHSAENGTFVIRQGSATVTFAAPTILSLDDVSCDCLLAPRCLHLAHALLRCEVSSAEARTEPASQQAPTEAAAGQGTLDGILNPGQFEVVERCLAAFVQLLVTGTSTRDPVQLSTFLRLAHGAKAQRLYTLGARCTAVAAMLTPADETARNTLVSAIADAYLAAHQLAHRHRLGQVPASLLGRPRRSFTAREALSLQGIFTEPIITATGHAGVATYLRGGEESLWSINSNMPLKGASAADQARQYYRRAPQIGGISTSHQDLTRRTLLVTNAKASDDGRLSAGAQVSAVAGGVSGWDKLWFDQNSPSADGVSFQELVVKGLSGTAIALAGDDGHFIAAKVTAAARELGALDDVLELARHPGTRLRCVLRHKFDSIELLAFAVDPTQIRLPEAWNGRVMLGLDRLAPSYFVAGPEPAMLFPPGNTGPWPLMVQWLGRMAVHGRAALLNDETQLAADVSRLTDSNCAHGAELLVSLRTAAHQGRTDFDGSLQYLDEPLAKAWLALAAFSTAWLFSTQGRTSAAEPPPAPTT